MKRWVGRLARWLGLPLPHKRCWTTSARLSVDVVVDVVVDGHLHIFVSMLTMRSSSARAWANKAGSESFRTRQASRIAAHSIAEPRAIA